MNNISICIIGRKTKDFTEHLTIIRQIKGLKVLKRRNKPFYDITGNINGDDNIATMRAALEYMLNNCGAEIEIKDAELRQAFFDMLK